MANYLGDKLNPTKFSRSQIKYYLILVPMAIFYLLPIIFIINNAFKPIQELFDYPPKFFVREPTTENFKDLLSALDSMAVPMGRYIVNTLFSTVVVIIMTLLISVYAGYALSKKKFRAQHLLNTINRLALMFVPITLTIPRFLVMRETGLFDTWFALILPLIAMPVGLFLLVQFISEVPDALLDAARIDGASENRIVLRIVVPIVKPALATVAMLAFQSAWSAIEPSNFYIVSDMLRTFAYYVTTLAAGAGNTLGGAGMIAAATLILFIPNVIIYMLMQRHILNTMAHSGIK